MPSLSTLGTDTGTLLALLAAQLTQAGIEVPARQQVAIGAVQVWDGEQLTVQSSSIEMGQPGRPYGGTAIPASAIVVYATFVIVLLRSIPVATGGPRGARVPNAATISKFGEQLSQDMGGLVNAAIQIQAAGEWAVPEGFHIGPCRPVGPDGGLAGSTLQLDVSLS